MTDKSALHQLLSQGQELGIDKYELLNPLVAYSEATQAAIRESMKQVARDDNGRPMMRYEDDGDTRMVYMYGMISAYDFMGITADMFSQAMPTDKDKPVQVHFNSGGGALFESLAMYSTLEARTGKVTGVLDSLCASAAVNVLMGCSERYTSQAGTLLVHQTRGPGYGTADDMRKQAELMDKMDDLTADLYAGATGKSKGDVMTLMKEDKMRTPMEAIQLGFCQGMRKKQIRQESPELIEHLRQRAQRAHEVMGILNTELP